MHPHLAVQLCLLPFHLIELGLQSLILIGQHLEPILQGGPFLLMTTNQFTVDLGFELDLSELSLGLCLPQSDRHQLVLQFVHRVLLRGFLPVASAAASTAATRHVMLQEQKVNDRNSAVSAERKQMNMPGNGG
ncbi:hypothetical protein GOODEAATRI_031875 [Goodea atripinnis]|uniref:Secreted protein n=1 Tax=Goodea atripinnis TaxID=208336 RepID=A0ABV0MME5_9TELE